MEAWVKRTLWQAFLDSTGGHGESTAVICDGRSASYHDLAAQAERVAKGLLRLGMRKDDKIALWLPNSIEFLVALLAVGRIGAVVVPLNTRYRQAEAEYVLRQSDSALVMVPEVAEPQDYRDMLYRICPELSTSPLGRLKSPQLPSLRGVTCLGHASPGMWGWEELQRLGEDLDGSALAEAERAVRPDDVALIQYTSGSTAFPKGVMLTHNNIVRNAWHLGEALKLAPGERYLVPLPFFHVGGLVTGAILALIRGGCLLTMARFEAEAMLRLIQEQRPAVLSGVETHYIMALDHPHFRRYDLSSIQRCIALGTGELIRRIHDQMGIPSVCTLYGISEASPNVTIVPAGEPLEVSLTSMGKPQPGVEVKIIDPESGATLPPGGRGEICVRGWNVMKGYYKQPEETAKAIDREGWLHTGDLGTLDREGRLIFLGRLKNVIRVGGENVSAEEVENCLAMHPKVKLAQVVGAPDPKLVNVCVAYVELRLGERASEEELITFCRQRLAGFKVPRRVRFVTEWPITGPGKIQRFQLQEMEREASDREANALARHPGGPTLAKGKGRRQGNGEHP